MKIPLIISLITSLFGCSTLVKKQVFVNPLFYKAMEPMSVLSWQTKITPTSLVSANKGTVLKQDCTLIENTIDVVTLRCEESDSPDYLYRFSIDKEYLVNYGTVIDMKYKSVTSLMNGSKESFIVYNTQ